MKTKTTQLLIFTAGLAVISVGIYFYGINYISGLSKKTSELKQEISNSEITYKHAQSLQEALKSAAGQKDKVSGYFVPANGAVDFIAGIEKTAESFGLQYSTDNISQKNNESLDSSNKELLQVAFSARGSWKQVMRLLQTIETLPYGMKVDKLDLSASTASSSRIWSANINFSVVKIKDNEKRN